MKKLFSICLITIIVLYSPTSFALNNEQVKQKIIEYSVSTYPGRCPCPYNTDRAGRSCGRRSAYSRAGGYSILCYPRDVTDEMVKSFLQKH